MQLYCNSLTNYKRLATLEVKAGDLFIGGNYPIRLQTMTTTDTMNTIATVEQSIRCIEAGAELVRITAPSKKEAENLRNIKDELRKRGYTTPLIADIHFTPNAAEIAARIVEKVRINPGNYVDKKKFEFIGYTDLEYDKEIDRIRERFTPLVKICREYGTAMRIGTNHGSLSDRIMSRYGDTPMGMVESAMEFLRIARAESYHNIILSMKSSNPQVMVQAYRLLVQQMMSEFSECYPLHLGVTEAGDGEDGRVKSAAGIGTLLEDGLGDTVRVSLTEDPEFEIPVCRDLVKRYESKMTVDGCKMTVDGEKMADNGCKMTDDRRGMTDDRKIMTDDGGKMTKKESALLSTVNHQLSTIHSSMEMTDDGCRMTDDRKMMTDNRSELPKGQFAFLSTVHQPSTVYHQPSTIHPSMAMTDDRGELQKEESAFLSTVHQLSTVNHQLSTVPSSTVNPQPSTIHSPTIPPVEKIPYDPFVYKRRETFAVDNIGEKHVPVVIADFSKIENILPYHLQSIGYTYNEATDKWAISDAAADYIFTGHQILPFALPGTLQVIVYPAAWILAEDKNKYFPIFQDSGFASSEVKSSHLNFVMIDCFNDATSINDFTYLDALAGDKSVVLCLSSTNPHAMPAVRRMFMELGLRNIRNPVVIICDSYWQTADEHLIHYATECGALLLDGFGDGICLGTTGNANNNASANNASGRNYLNNTTVEQFINSTAFSILQATRTRISKTEYISCPSCGRTLFELQETTAKIRSVTNHLKGVKIAIMGCIVNGPGEMADADFGYVGSGVGKITLYKGKEVVKRNVDSDIAVSELILLLKESDSWVDPVIA